MLITIKSLKIKKKITNTDKLLFSMPGHLFEKEDNKSLVFVYIWCVKYKINNSV